jgi:hypothetical protein
MCAVHAHSRQSVVFLLALSIGIANAHADDLSSAFSQAQRMIQGARSIGTSPRETPQATPSSAVQTVNNAESRRIEANSALEELNAAVAELDAYGKAIFDTLNAADKQSVASAIYALASEYRNALVRLENARRRLAEARRRLSSMGAELHRLGIEEQARRQVIAGIGTRSTYLRTRISQQQQALAKIDEDRQWARAQYKILAAKARLARNVYWQACREFFEKNKLGTPREYMRPVGPLRATTMRRPPQATSVGQIAKAASPVLIEPAKPIVLSNTKLAMAAEERMPIPETEEGRRQQFVNDMNRVEVTLRNAAATAKLRCRSSRHRQILQGAPTVRLPPPPPKNISRSSRFFGRKENGDHQIEYSDCR